MSPLIIGHRGASALAPENTIAAFRRAIEDGAEGIELDVRLTKDGVAVVHHDATLKRTGGKEIRIDQCTADELERTDIGSWFAQAAPERWRPEYASERVATLASVLECLAEYRGLVYIELKSGEGEDIEVLVQKVCDVVTRARFVERIIIKSFRLAFIPHVRAHCPGVRTAALFAPKIMTILRKEKYMADLAVEFGADELSVHYSLATKKLMKNAEKRGFRVTVWTVDHPRWLRRSIRLGVNAIITNDPGRLIRKRLEIIKPG